MKLSTLLPIAALAPLVACAPHAQHPHGDSPTQIARYHFNMMDVNRDGVVTQAEFQSAMQVKWTAIDADGNGIITPAEVESHEWHQYDGLPAHPPAVKPYPGGRGW